MKEPLEEVCVYTKKKRWRTQEWFQVSLRKDGEESQRVFTLAMAGQGTACKVSRNMTVCGQRCLSATGKWPKQRNSCSCTLIVSHVAFTLAVNEAQSAKGVHNSAHISATFSQRSSITPSYYIPAQQTLRCSNFPSVSFSSDTRITFDLRFKTFPDQEEINQKVNRRICVMRFFQFVKSNTFESSTAIHYNATFTSLQICHFKCGKSAV